MLLKGPTFSGVGWKRETDISKDYGRASCKEVTVGLLGGSFPRFTLLYRQH